MVSSARLFLPVDRTNDLKRAWAVSACAVLKPGLLSDSVVGAGLYRVLRVGHRVDRVDPDFGSRMALASANAAGVIRERTTVAAKTIPGASCSTNAAADGRPRHTWVCRCRRPLEHISFYSARPAGGRGCCLVGPIAFEPANRACADTGIYP